MENPTNEGIIASLNKGIDFAKGEYIMRMDADDISYPTRAYEQITFLEKNPSISACGTWVKTIGGVINRVRKYPCDPNYIKCHLLFETPIVHPTVMFRKKDLIAYNLFYDNHYSHAEDFELWSRLCNVSSFATIDKVLLGYRLNKSGISYQNSHAQLLMKKKIVKNIFSYLHYEPTEQELGLHFLVMLGDMKQYLQQITDLESWFYKIVALNDNSQYYNSNVLIEVLRKRWTQIFLVNLNYGPKAWHKFTVLHYSLIKDVPFQAIFMMAYKARQRKLDI